jgi:hypothetical protein
MDASGTRSGGYGTEVNGHSDEENLFGPKQAGNKAEGEGEDRQHRLALALKTSSADVPNSPR